MQELIKIENQIIGTSEVSSVNSRELHIALEIKKDFSNWIKSQISVLGLEENIDFIKLALKGERKSYGLPSTKIDYIITTDTAKHISMASRTPKGKEVRAYFIEVEKRYKVEQPQLQNNELQTFMMKSFEVMIGINKNIETMLKATINTSNNVERLKSTIRQLDDKIDRIGSVAIKTDLVLKDTYNYVKYQPLSREERTKLSDRIKQRGVILSKMYNVTKDIAIASIYRMLNKAFDLTTYHELEHKDFLSAYDWVDYCELGSFQSSPTVIKQPLEEEYGEDISEEDKSTSRNVYGDRIL